MDRHRLLPYFDKLVSLTTNPLRGSRLTGLCRTGDGLDPRRFFRANRAFLVNIDAVLRCSPYGKGKLLIELRPAADEEVVVSQEKAGAWRKWLGE